MDISKLPKVRYVDVQIGDVFTDDYWAGQNTAFKRTGAGEESDMIWVKNGIETHKGTWGRYGQEEFRVVIIEHAEEVIP